MDQTTLRIETSPKPVLHVAFELSASKWKLGMTAEGLKRREVTLEAGDLAGVRGAVEKARLKFGLPTDARVVSCYEAGRDGFWLHRALVAAGIENVVVDSTSIHVDRRLRRAKTDRIDVYLLLEQLVRHTRGEPALRGVRVPDAAAEDARRPHRELERLNLEATAHGNRIKSLLVLHGLRLELGSGFEQRLDEVRLHDGTPLPAALRAEILREHERLDVVRGQLNVLKKERTKHLKEATGTTADKSRTLQSLRGIGPAGATVLATEFFGWRVFKNRKEVAACAGLAPTPFASGSSTREQGISKAGNRRVRLLLIELAWGWLRFQPQSKLSLWFHARFGAGGGRNRRVGIVALARKLLVALWRYTEFGVVPEGAIIKQ